MNNETYQLSDRPLGLTIGLYQILDQPVAPRSITLEESAVRLIPSNSKDKPELTTLLVLSRDLATQWKILDPSTISVYETETLTTVDFDSLSNNKKVLPTLSPETQFSTVNLRKAEWRSPEDFFTDRILLIENPDREEHQELFPGVREVKGQQTLTKRPVPILPIKSELLKYLDIDYLAENITISQKNNNEIVVELKLRLNGVDGQGKDLTVKRQYKDDEIERRSNNNLPVLEVWPNFKADNWKFYYTYYDSVGLKEEDTFSAKPYLERGKLLAQKPDSKPRQIWHSESLPTAMMCETYSRKLKSNIEIGCLLMDVRGLSKPEPQLTFSWDIGVDFGTSSTNIYVIKSNETKPSEVSFQNRLFQITKSSYREDIVKYFFPPFELSAPFLTLFRSELNIAEESNKPLLRGNIRYVKPSLSWNPDGKEIDVKSRFKWQFEVQPIEGFLEQLALQCLAEAVAEGATKVSWYVSFPTVFERHAEKISGTAWENIIELTRSVEIITPEKPIKKTESVASANFFDNQHKVTPVGVICIDIGGETSDISILDNGIPRECSVRFAGEHFFSDLLKRNPSVLEDLKFQIEDIERLKKSAKTYSFHSQLDSLIGMNKEELWKKLRQVDLRDPDGKVYGLLHLITLGLSGLIFYAGLQLNDTKAKGKLKSDRLNHLCLGGNGAWTLQWLGRGNFGLQSPQNSLFQQVLKTASGLEQDTDVEIILSQKPKAEVAYGLIVPTDTRLEPSEPDEQDEQDEQKRKQKIEQKRKEAKVEISGEDFRDNQGQPQSWNTKLTTQLLASGLKAPEQLSQLQQFIEVFNQYANTDYSYVRKVEINPYKNRINSDMQARLNNFKNLGHNKILAVEPLFIIALRRLLEEETERWTKDWK